MSLAMDPEVEHFFDTELEVAACYDPRDDETYVLVLSALHHCGHSEWHMAPASKIPADHGGGFPTGQCPRCLGTLSYDEEWWPRSEFTEVPDNRGGDGL